MPDNPFTPDVPATDPAHFCGRRQEIRQIANRLLSSAHESTSLVGDRRMGKTSLLCYITHPDVAPTLGLAAGRYCLVYVDLQGLTDLTPQRFWQRVLAKMAGTAPVERVARAADDLRQRSELDLLDLEDLFELVSETRLHMVLLLDEFEYVTQNSSFSIDFFGALRTLAIHHPVSLVTSTRRELVDLCYSDELTGSPFFNILASVVLRPFSQTEVAALVQQYTAASGIDMAAVERDMVYAFGGGHPFLVQVAGHAIVEGKQRGLSGQALDRYVAERFAAQAARHYASSWTHLCESERVALLTLTALMRRSEASGHKRGQVGEDVLDTYIRTCPHARRDVATLARCGLIHEQQGPWASLSPGLARWLSTEVAARADDDERAVSAGALTAGRNGLPGKDVLSRFRRRYWPAIAQVSASLAMCGVKVEGSDITGLLL